LLVVTTVFAVWLGLTMARVRQQRSAVQALQAANASILYNYQSTGERSWARTAKPQGAKWLRAVLGGEYYDRPVWVSVHGDALGGNWVNAVNALTTVKTLRISGVTDDVITRLTSSGIEELRLSESSISARALESLAQLPKLRRLELASCPITDADVAQFAKLPALEILSLEDAPVTDAAIPSIAKIPKLRCLCLWGTQISAKRVGELQRQRSHLMVMFEELWLSLRLR
jgi:hypothetical protein